MIQIGSLKSGLSAMPPSVPPGPLHGCGTKIDPVSCNHLELPPQPKFTDHVAPILNAQCGECHSETTLERHSAAEGDDWDVYQATVEKVDLIIAQSSNGLMPNVTGLNLGLRHLTEAELCTLQLWRDSGLTE